MKGWVSVRLMLSMAFWGQGCRLALFVSALPVKSVAFPKAASLVNCAASALIDDSIVSAPAVTNAEQAPVAEYVVPVTTITYAAPLQSSSI